MTANPKSSNTEAPRAQTQRAQTLPIAIVFSVLVLAMVVAKARFALVLWALDGAAALLTLFTAMCVGLGVLRILRLGDVARFWKIVLATGIGVGWLSLLTLGCGLAGWIGEGHRYVLPGVFFATGAAGWLFRPPKSSRYDASSARRWVPWLLLIVAPVVSLILLSATLPPGVAWEEEGYGYDVLEYHLQVPKEYFEAGRIEYLPHNVYASFPSAAEMLFLFGNQLMGETIGAWPIAKCINALLVLLIVLAAAAIGRETSVGCGVSCAVIAGSSGWLAYLGGIAYVEGGMLLMGMLSVGCVLRAVKSQDRPTAFRWIMLAGMLAGFACGFKYTAVVLIAIPTCVLIFVISKRTTAQRLRWIATFTAGCAVTFSPWLIKNVAMTGNPVFPLMGEWFDAYPPGWGEAQSAHFTASHKPQADEAQLSRRVGRVWSRIIADPAHRFGAVMLALALVAWPRHRSRTDAALLIMLLLQVLVWIFATHLYARFAVPMLIPLILLSGRGATSKGGSLTGGFAIILLAGATLNIFYAYMLYANHTEHDGERFFLEGATSAFTQGKFESQRHVGFVNGNLPEDAYVLLVGDAKAFYLKRKCDYCVVFNQNPFAEAVAAATSPEAILNWLREQGYTHVLVHFGEMQRLRKTYGFWEPLTPSLFAQLNDAGLTEVKRFTIDDGAKTYAVLYELTEGNE